MPTVAIEYRRVSSEQQAGDTFTSLSDQHRAIAALAARLGVPIVQAFEDPGFSGATVEKRPGFQQLLRYCETHKRSASEPGFVLVLNDSRWGRFADPDEAAHWRVVLRRLGWIVRYAEGDDIEDAGTRSIMRAVGSAEASRYRSNLVANSIRGRIGTTQQGYWATREPFGYQRQVVYPPEHARLLPKGQAKARGERIKLTPKEPEASVVRELALKYASGEYSLSRLAREAPAICRRHGVADVPAFPTIGLRKLFENLTYLGHIPCRRQTAADRTRRDFTRRPPEYVVRDAHPPILTQAIFDSLQDRLADIPPQSRGTDYRLRGLVRCTFCGEPYMGGGVGGRRSDGTRAHFYMDQGGRTGPCRPIGTVGRHLLEPAAIAEVAQHVRAQSTRDNLRAAFAARMAVVTQEPAPSVRLERELAGVRRKVARLVDAIASGTLEPAEARAQLQQLRAQQAELEARLAAARPAEPRDVRDTLSRLTALAEDLPSLAAQATGPELRALLHPWVESMTFNRETRMLTLRLFTLDAHLGARAGTRPLPSALPPAAGSR